MFTYLRPLRVVGRRALFEETRRCLSHSACLHNHYHTLGVSKSATPTQIKEAYMILAKKWHPDRLGENINKDEAHKKFVQITAAFDVLKDPLKRKEYDVSNIQHSSGPRPFYPNQSGSTRYSSQTQGGTNYNFYSDEEYEFKEPYEGESPYKIMSNGTVVVLAVVWMVLGTLAHMWRMDEIREEFEAFQAARSKTASEFLERARLRARENGNEEQLRRLRADV
eukprot:m.53076 g.53076  ORF g.53076 m.53076 type:complete len:223 (-) comp10839_c0_seq3:1156-1824(-)